MKSVLAFQNCQNLSDLIVERTQPVTESGEPKKASKENSAVIFRLRHHDDHDEQEGM